MQIWYFEVKGTGQGFPQNLMGGGGGLKSKHEGSIGELQMLSKNRYHLILKLQQTSKFTKNKLLHTYFSRILARFPVIIYCAFSRNHFMEGCFMFQWGGGGLFFRWGASFLSGGAPHGMASVLVGEFSKKIVRWRGGEGVPPMPPSPLWETLLGGLVCNLLLF